MTIVEYASMTCSHCAHFHSTTYPLIKKDFMDTGKAKLIIREFPFDPRALAGFMLARCTGDDAKRTAMVDVLFSQQDDWARSQNASAALLKIAKLAGMSQDEFKLPERQGDAGEDRRDPAERPERIRRQRDPDLLHQWRQVFRRADAEQMSAAIHGHL